MKFKQFIFITVFSLSLSQPIIAKDNIVIGAAVSTFADKWFTYVIDAIKNYDEANDDVIIEFADANNDSAKMLNNIENFIEQKVNAVIVHPIDRNSLRPIALKLKRAGIPLIVVNRRPFDKDMKYVATYVGSDEVQAGHLQGEYIKKALNGKEGRVGILLGPLGLDGQVNRTKGNKDVFSKTNNIKVLAEQEGKWERDRGLAIAEDWLQSNKNLNVISSNNDEMAIGALLALNKAGVKDEDFIVVGVDGTPDALDYLGKGLDATIYQDATGQGTEAAKAAHQLSKGLKVEHIINVPFQIITIENKKQFIR